VSRYLLSLLFALFAHGPVARPALPAPMPVIHYSVCPDSPPGFEWACTYPSLNVIYSPPDQGAYVLHHELGHMYLTDYLDDWERAQLAPVLGYRRWRPAVAERAADLYAACRMRVRPSFEDGWDPPRGRWAYGCELLAADRG
jgi:hypothetical protein